MEFVPVAKESSSKTTGLKLLPKTMPRIYMFYSSFLCINISFKLAILTIVTIYSKSTDCALCYPFANTSSVLTEILEGIIPV